MNSKTHENEQIMRTHMPALRRLKAVIAQAGFKHDRIQGLREGAAVTIFGNSDPVSVRRIENMLQELPEKPLEEFTGGVAWNGLATDANEAMGNLRDHIIKALQGDGLTLWVDGPQYMEAKLTAAGVDASTLNRGTPKSLDALQRAGLVSQDG